MPIPIRPPIIACDELTGTPTRTKNCIVSSRDTYPLKAENRFEKKIMDASYRIYVAPNEDTPLRFQTRHFQAGHLFRAIVILIVLAVVAGTLPFILATLRG